MSVGGGDGMLAAFALSRDFVVVGFVRSDGVAFLVCVSRLVEEVLRNGDGCGFVSWRTRVWFELAECPDVWKRLQRQVAPSLDGGDEYPLSNTLTRDEVFPGRTQEVFVNCIRLCRVMKAKRESTPYHEFEAGRLRILQSWWQEVRLCVEISRLRIGTRALWRRRTSLHSGTLT